MSGTEDFDYQFNAPNGTADTFIVSVDDTPSNSTGDGTSYKVEAIYGSVDGTAIGGLVGNGGEVQNNGTFIFDNAIFTSPSGGLTYDGASGSTAGIDVGGLLFNIGSVDYNLYNYNGQFILIDSTNPSDQTDLNLIHTNAPCFCAGTLILTNHGEVAVEDLVIGDSVITIGGTSAAIRWIGRRAIATRFMDPLKAMPIRIKAGALSESTPARDLRLSPDHAVLTGGILAQAGALVNGSSIVREIAAPETFTYYHIELADHSLILAEGAAVETFVDNTDRMGFDNWAEYEALVQGEETIAEMDLPRAKAHRQVPSAVRAMLAGRAAALATGETARLSA